jgi:hypothetical protein
MGNSDRRLRGRITRIILLLEYVVIVALVWALSLEYQSNAYLRAWIEQNAALAGYFLTGYFAAILLGILLAILAVQTDRYLRQRREQNNPKA